MKLLQSSNLIKIIQMQVLVGCYFSWIDFHIQLSAASTELRLINPDVLMTANDLPTIQLSVIHVIYSSVYCQNNS